MSVRLSSSAIASCSFRTRIEFSIDSGGGASKNGNFLTSGRPIETIWEKLRLFRSERARFCFTFPNFTASCGGFKRQTIWLLIQKSRVQNRKKSGFLSSFVIKNSELDVAYNIQMQGWFSKANQPIANPKSSIGKKEVSRRLQPSRLI